MADPSNNTVEWQAQQESPPPEYSEYYTQELTEDWRDFTLLERTHQIKSWIQTKERMEARFNALETQIAQMKIDHAAEINGQNTEIAHQKTQIDQLRVDHAAQIHGQNIKIADQDIRISYLMRQFNVIKGRGLLKIISAISPTRDVREAYTGFELVANKLPEDLQELINQFNHLSHALTLAEARSLFLTMWENFIGSFVGWRSEEQEEYGKILFGMTGATLKRITELGGKFISRPFI